MNHCRVLAMVSVLTVGAAPWAGAGAQQPDLASDSVAVALVALIEALPGRPVPLDQLVQDALVHNLDAAAARLTSGIASAGLTEAKGPFDPSVSLFSNVEKDPRSSAVEFGGYGVGVSQRLALGTEIGLDLLNDRSSFFFGATPQSAAFLSSLSLSLTQPVLEGFNQADVGVRAARADELAAQSDQRRAEELVAAAIEQRYWDLQEAEAQEAVYRQSVDAAETLVFRNEQLFNRDLASEIDVITARSGAALRRATLLAAQRSRRDASDVLIFQVYGETAADVLAVDSLPIKTTAVPLDDVGLEDLDALVAGALVARRDVEADRRRLEGFAEIEKATRNALAPELDVFGSVTTGGAGVSAGESAQFLDDELRWSLGLSFSQPIGNREDRGRQRAATQQAMLAELDVTRTENRVRAEVRAADRAVRWGLLRLQAAQETATTARQQLAGEARRLELGLGDSFRLLLTEENAVQGELTLVQARFDLARALTALRLATGTTLERY